ncbi:DnaJ-domain-containing protein [Fomitiporia mediterranea MF3/22]|uniref:DnaJ-domain-containing protein n=1 Tax=Fomitiporia mediterranea (strain MF3/22) TaxID=694068 RepID=UPI00044092F3|nr:DnaJ-domain-containing protein [Fomitiporia mediterranea MF3/22]EJD07708.1 DnaJ-domain-containing protein [Fomitiporia mediterranea MF3/22]
MESNKDEALKCLAISQRHCNSGNYPAARRFAEKSLSLFPTPEATKLLQRIADLESEAPPETSSSAGPSGSTTSAETHPSASGTRHRHANANTDASTSSSQSIPNGNVGGSKQEKRDYTPEQEAIVKRIRTCKVTEYYEIMSLKRDCTETEVKKAYRKLALQLHPDKNNAPGADEAFKMVSKAFQIVSDEEKRAAYDRYGSDPESRFGGMSSAAGGSPGFAGGPFGAGSFEGELSPEDLFNMFFGGGGGMGGSPFGGPGVFTASFGPGGFRTTRVHMGGRRAQPQQREGDMPVRTLLAQLAPLIILFLFTFLSAVPNLFSSPRTPDPRYSFTPSSRFTTGRETEGLNVKYFVNQAEFAAHPIAKDLEDASTRSDGRSSLLDRFERNVEANYIDQVYMLCQRDQERQQRRKEAKMGFLGLGSDWDAIRAINAEKLESCEEYSRVTGRR